MLTGKDKEALHEIVSIVLNDSDEYTAIFGYFNHWEKKGRTTTTYYYYYVVAFKSDELLVIPMNYDSGVFTADAPTKIDPNELSKVEYSKDAQVTEFYDKNNERVLSYLTPPITSNADAKECPVAIDQSQEVEKYSEFMRDFVLKCCKEA